MNKAPDTRNKLDSNKGLNKRKKSLPVRKHQFKELKEALDGPIKLKAEKKPTKGKLFKDKHGFSKTQKRLFQKAGITIVDMLKADLMASYIPIRKRRKALEKKARQKKHSDNVIYRRTHVKDKKSGKSSKKSK